VAFGNDFEALCNWPAEARFPTIVATVPINDPPKARKIVDALTSLPVAGAEWTHEDRDGVTVFSIQPFGVQLGLSPAIVFSGNSIYLGTEVGAIETLRARLAKPGRELEKSGRFRSAIAQVPDGDCAFNYVDTQLTWERLDATLRPLLAMSATLYPALSKDVDLARIPPAEAITKHLSPIVMSQRFEKEGYITESVGPITFRAATLGIGAGIGGSLVYLREGLKNAGFAPAGNQTPGAATPVPSSASPTPSPP
jgi:hypothetical protein